MSNSNPTQAQRVLDYMIEVGSITQLEALSELGVMRLASRIADLRRQGFDIISKSVPVVNRYGETCYIKCYRLREDAEEVTGYESASSC